MYKPHMCLVIWRRFQHITAKENEKEKPTKHANDKMNYSSLTNYYIH